MFYTHKITKIKSGDRVLEIGPGGSPSDRADVFLELKISEADLAKQRGNVDKPTLTKPIVYYDGQKFPFENKEFDYVICSHVLEHTPSPEQFLSEVFRVGKRGYLEFPTILYDYLYNFSVHLNLLSYTGDKILYLSKSDTNLNDFLPIQHVFLDYLEMGHDSIVKEMKPKMFQGFEWVNPVAIRKAMSIKELITEMTSSGVSEKLTGQRSFKRRLLDKIKL